jgi:hypothetical protein
MIAKASIQARLQGEKLMNRTRNLVAALGTAAVGAAAMFSTAASAGGNVSWSVSVGGPGFAVAAGQPYYGAPYRPYYRPYKPYYHRPAPVVHRPYYRPYYAPRPVYVAPRVVYTQPYAYYPAPVVPIPY